jgi:xanthine/uracil permease
MGLGVGWTLHGDGRVPAPGAVVRPDERLSWPRTIGLGAQHVVAMFGASFVAHNDLRNPLNLVPTAAGVVIGIGGVSLKISDNFELSGIALGTIVVVAGYHGLRALAPAHMRQEPPLLDAGTSAYDDA